MSHEGAPIVNTGETASEIAVSEAEYAAKGQELLAEMGVTDLSFGALGVSAGDPEGRCVGTLAEAVGRHEAFRANVRIIVADALTRGVSPEEAAKENPFFSPYLAKDAQGEPFHVSSSEEVKKN
jgi:hypothetical protein